MADSDKNILITPATGTTSEPTVKYTGKDIVSITNRVLDDGTLSWEGTAGQLFSITNSLTGTIFSVNDISGIPSLEILDTGEIRLAQYSGNVGIGKSSPTTKLDVNGTITATTFSGAGTSLTGVLLLTGGTLTGDLTISKASPLLSINATSGPATVNMDRINGQNSEIRFRTGTSTRWNFYTSGTESSGNAGSDLYLRSYADDGTTATTLISITRSTGVFSFGGNVNVVKADAVLRASSATGVSWLYLDSPSNAPDAIIAFRTGTTERWRIGKGNSESSANAGSNLVFQAYSDAGSLLFTPISITRSTGLTTVGNGLTVSGGNVSFISGGDFEHRKITGGNAQVYHKYTVDGTMRMAWMFASDLSLNLRRYDSNGAYVDTPLSISNSSGLSTFGGDMLVQKANPYIQVNATSGTALVTADSVAGSASNFALRTGNSYRWIIGKNTTAESGSDAGSDFVIKRYSDAGAGLGDALTITRSTGNATFSGSVSASALTATGANGITVNGGLTYLQPGSNASNALWVRGKASQASSLVLFQNDAGTTLSSIGADGSFNGPAALSGTPTATTAAVDTNTTQIATTAYVVGQGYLKSATASSTYAPLASPTFTGTVTIPTLVGTDVTDSSSTTTGAATFAGGLGVAKNVHVGGSLNIRGTSTLNFNPTSGTTSTISTNVNGGTINIFSVNTWGTLNFGVSGSGPVNLWGTSINLKGLVVPNNLDLNLISDTSTAATHYFVEIGDGLIRPKTLADVKTEIVTTAAVNSAAATTLGTVTTGVWNTGTIANQTSSYTLNIGGGAATTGQTKDINIGQNGLSGSTVNVNIGTTTSGVTSSVNIYGASIVFKPAGYITSTLNIPHGTAPDGVIQNGDVWTTTSGFFARINGTTQQFAHLASPAFSGTPTAPTAAVDTNTTQLATTAYVIGQGYLKTATASSTYAPLANPTFTGTVANPSGTIEASDVRAISDIMGAF